MIIIKKLLTLVHVLFTVLSITIVTFQGILQLFEYHNPLIIHRHAPTDINLLELRPIFDKLTIRGPHTPF